MHRFVRRQASRRALGWLLLGLTAVVLCRSGTAASTRAWDDTAAAALSTFLMDAVHRGDTPGVVVLVTSPDRVLYHEAFGALDASRSAPLPKDAIFRIASMTKPLTSVAVMMLVEQGKLRVE